MKFNLFKKKKPQKRKTKLIEWRDSIVFAVVVATLFRWSFVEAFMVPTPSMENTILVGDYLFVSKFHYGPRTPRTPLQLPLTHQKIWGTEIPSYLDWVELPSYRLPGLRGVERGEPVVFNIPPAILNDGEERPIDLKTYYVKRCVAIAGDRLEIRNKQIFVNGEPLENPENMKFSYLVIAKDEIHQRHLDKLELTSDDYYSMGQTADARVVYKMLLTPEQRNEVEALPFVLSVEEDFTTHDGPDANIFPAAKTTSWNGDNYGPLVMPAKGMKMIVNDSTLALYGEMIQLHEENERVSVTNGELTIDGESIKEYTFKQDYYFMMGDNRHNSLDSRYWGFVPENHILGKPLFIWLSINNEADLLHKIRWHRMFTLIE
ncbi:MAG: signal peptidase I [Cyclobacteriaceae bacterium]|nr:signal peptidase I [Cyclobacteriaceae bacterium]